ncbi:MAG: hypothetical protein JXR83_05235 [Deltaproteobacteria bacterium]|nr:hypothetical protein [Deltaproteobacteria bacterium]
MRGMRALFATIWLWPLACATAPAPVAGAKPVSAAVPPAPAVVVAKQQELCQAQPAATRSQLEEILTKVNADLEANGQRIAIGAAQIENTECSISASGGKHNVDVIQRVELKIEVTGKTPVSAMAYLSHCYTLAPAADDTGCDIAPCENAEVLERYNIESLQTAINDELYRLERIRVQID